MKKLLMIATISSLSIITVFAQRGPGGDSMTPEKRAERMTNRMAKQLELNDEQQKQVYGIYLEHANQRHVERENRRAEMQKQHNQQRDRIESVLNPEQKEKLEELKEERLEKREKVREARQNPDSDKIRDWKKSRPRSGNRR